MLKTWVNVNRFQHGNAIFIKKSFWVSVCYINPSKQLCPDLDYNMAQSTVLFMFTTVRFIGSLSLTFSKSFKMTENWQPKQTTPPEQSERLWAAAHQNHRWVSTCLAVCHWPESASFDYVKLAQGQDEICCTSREVHKQQLPMCKIQHLMVKTKMVWIFNGLSHIRDVCTSVSACVSLHIPHAHLDQYKPQSSSIQGLVSLQCLNISWKQKRENKHELWCSLNVWMAQHDSIKTLLCFLWK